MRRPPRIANSWTIGRLVCTVAALSLLTLPVQYRGGAELPHGHAFVQVWLDAAHGSTFHHDRLEAVAHPDHAHHHGDERGALAGEAHPERDAARDRPVVAGAGSPDATQLSEVTLAIERFAVVLAVAVLGLSLVLLGLAPVRPALRALSGLRPIPETPPPRPAVALA